MQIIAIRHTKVDIAENICYGQSDVPLCNTFSKELENVQGLLKQFKISRFYSSPSTRCINLSKALDSEISTDKRLLEYNFGEWELKTWDEISTFDLYTHWSSDYINIPAPNGESMIDMIDRVKQFLIEISNYNYKNVGIVTHSGVIRCLYAILEKKPIQNLFNIKVDFGSIHQFSFISDPL